MWDIAYAVYRFVPLTGDDAHAEALGLTEPTTRSRRLRLFCDAYGLDDRRGLPEMVEQRLEALCALLRERAAAGELAFRRMIADGHPAFYELELAFLREHRLELQQHLS